MPLEPQSSGAPQVEAEALVKGSVGALLQASRHRLGIDLAVIADTLRIRLVYLQAIEDGRYEALPGETYAVGFIRSYADQLGLDGMELVRRFKLETGSTPTVAPQLVSFSKLVKTLGLPIGAIVTVAVVVGGLALGAWFLFSSGESTSLLPKIPAALNEKVGAPASSAPEVVSLQPEPPMPEAVVEEPPKPKPVKEVPKPVVEAPKPAQIAPKAAVEAPKPSASVEDAEGLPETPETVARGPRVYGQENAGARVEIVASGDSWVQVTEGGSLVLTRLLHPGDRFMVPNRKGLLLMTGNAGGLEILVDGRKTQSVGAAGQVMRDVSLDTDRLLAGRKASE